MFFKQLAFRYKVVGGMQDFNYVHSNAMEITFELSCCKYPNASEMPKHWRMNKESLLKYLEQAHIGIKGSSSRFFMFPLVIHRDREVQEMERKRKEHSFVTFVARSGC